MDSPTNVNSELMALGCPDGDGCSLQPVHQRMRAIKRLWWRVAEMYDEPEEFVTYLNSCIQELRNLTFIIQKQKSSIAGFDEWYQSWVEVMKGDRVMRWVVQSRNRVVKMGDLETTSHASVSILTGYEGPPAYEFEVPPATSSAEVLSRVASAAPPELERTAGKYKVERIWRESQLPDWELLDALGHCYGVLTKIVTALHCQLANEFREKTWGSLPGDYADVEAREWEMISTLALRTCYRDLVSGETTAIGRLEMDGYQIKKLRAHPLVVNSGEVELIDDSTPLRRLASATIDRAKCIVRSGMQAYPCLFLILESGKVGMIGLQFRDKASKYSLMESMGEEAEKRRATGAVMVSEAWIRRITEDDKEAIICPTVHDHDSECLAISAYSIEEKGFCWTLPIERQSDPIAFGDLLEGPLDGILMPVVRGINRTFGLK